MAFVPYALTRRLLFKLDPERAHEWTLDALAALQGGAGRMLWSCPRIDDPVTLAPSERKASYLSNRMRELGVLMSTDGPFHNVLKIKPPIVFDKKDADFLMGMLERVLREDAMQLP